MKRLFLLILLIFYTSIITFAQWFSLDPGTSSHIYCVHFSDNSKGWICGNNNLIKQTDDGGETWENTAFHGGTNGSSDFNWYGIFAANENDVYACGSKFIWDRFLFNYAYTTSGGTSWDYQSNWGNAAGSWRQVFFIDDQHGWKIGTQAGNGWVGHTTTGVENFNNSPVFDDQGLKSVHFVDQNTGWVSGTNGFIAKSTDAGVSWTELQTGLTTEDLNKVFFINSMTGWAVGDEDDMGIIIKTTDGGASWNAVNIPATMELNGLYFVNENVGWACGSKVVNQEERGLILYSDDAGENWTEQYVSDELSELYDVFFINEFVGWASGYHGILLKTTNAGGTHFEGINENISLNSLAISPNPFTTSTTISYTLKQPSSIQLSVVNQLGQLVYQYREEQDQGEKQWQLDTQGLAEGLYFYRLEVGSEFATGKMIKVR